MCHHPGGSAPFSLLTYAEAKRRATLDRLGHQVAVHAAVESGSRQRSVRRSASAERAPRSMLLQRWVTTGAPEGDADDRPRVCATRRPASSGPRAGSSAHPISSSRCPSRTRCRPTAPTCSASSWCRCRSIACASCAASSSGPATPRSCTTRTSASTRRPRRARSTRPTQGPGYSGLILRSATIPTGTSSAGRQARSRRCCRRVWRGVSRPDRSGRSSCTCSRAASRSWCSRRSACTSATSRRRTRRRCCGSASRTSTSRPATRNTRSPTRTPCRWMSRCSRCSRTRTTARATSVARRRCPTARSER